MVLHGNKFFGERSADTHRTPLAFGSSLCHLPVMLYSQKSTHVKKASQMLIEHLAKLKENNLALPGLRKWCLERSRLTDPNPK